MTVRSRSAAEESRAPDLRRADFYADAEIYDVLHASGTRAEYAALKRILRRFVGTRVAESTWLEPACGTARILRAAATDGAAVWGFDRSPHMVRYGVKLLRESCPTARHRLRVAEMADFAGRFPKGRVDLAFNLINTIRHLESDAAMRSHLDDVAQLLAPRGVYAVGISLSAYGLEGPSEDVWKGRRGGSRVAQVVNYIPPMIAPEFRRRSERVLSHMTIHRGRGEEHVDSSYTLRTYDTGQWQALLARARWKVLAVLDQDSDPTPIVEPGYAVWILQPGG